MDTHAFPKGVMVQRFYLTLVGQARLGYESVISIALDWNGLQNLVWTTIFKDRKYYGAIISCVEIITL